MYLRFLALVPVFMLKGPALAKLVKIMDSNIPFKFQLFLDPWFKGIGPLSGR